MVPKKTDIIILTGYSGSGKSTALDALEDAGYYCVDNLPVALLPKFLELPLEPRAGLTGLAFVMDLRAPGFLTAFPPLLKQLRREGYRLRLVFLEADEATLVRRYSQTRRQHPLAQAHPLTEAIHSEIEQLEALRRTADVRVATSRHTVHELKAVIRDIARRSRRLPPLKLTLLSFGFKYGLPQEADLVVDVRFLPNPYFDETLRDMDGRQEAVRRFVLDNPPAGEFLRRYRELLDYLLPLYQKEGKSYLTVAVGCTGGRHRSVAIVGRLEAHWRAQRRQVTVIHRDVDRSEA